MKSLQEINRDAQDAFNEAELHCENGEYEQAISFYQQAIDSWGGDPCHYYNRIGNAFDNLGKYENAIQAYRTAIKLDDTRANIYYNMGITLDNLKEYEDAIKSYEKAIRVDPTHPCCASVFYNMGVAFDNLKQYEEAVQSYRIATEIDNNHANAYFNMGETYAKLGASKETILAFYDKAIEINPNESDYLDSRDKILLDISKNKEAEALENTKPSSDTTEISSKLEDIAPIKEKPKKQFNGTGIAYDNIEYSSVEELLEELNSGLHDAAVQINDPFCGLAGYMRDDYEG